jgi:hypothetical protein
MSRLLHGLVSGNFEDIRGTQIAATIPITEHLLNEIAAGGISQTRGRIQQFDIQIGSDNYLQIGMKVAVGPFSKWFRPELVVSARAQPPVLVLTLASREYSGLIWLAELFAKEVIPRGLSIRGSQVVVELDSIPPLVPYREILRHLTALDATTSRGIMRITFQAKID